jgi:hypothetical protein
MAYDVTFASGRKVTVHNTAFLNSEQVRERAIALHRDREYRYDPETGRGRWFDIEITPIVRIEQMVEIYVNGGYCLVPAREAR